MLQFSEFVWILRSSVLVVFNKFLLIDATDKSKISSDQKRFFIALSLDPLSFFTNTPFNLGIQLCLETKVNLLNLELLKKKLKTLPLFDQSKFEAN